MDERRAELGLTWTEVARRAGLTPEALRLIRTKSTDLQRSTKDGIERALLWEPGSVDAVLAGGDPTTQPRAEATQSGPSPHTVAAATELTFEEALEVYGKALQQLRRAATIDREVSPETLAIVEDWDTMFTGLRYGGVTAVYRMLAERYQQLLAEPKSSDQAG